MANHGRGDRGREERWGACLGEASRIRPESGDPNPGTPYRFPLTVRERVVG